MRKQMKQIFKNFMKKRKHRKAALKYRKVSLKTFVKALRNLFKPKKELPFDKEIDLKKGLTRFPETCGKVYLKN